VNENNKTNGKVKQRFLLHKAVLRESYRKCLFFLITSSLCLSGSVRAELFNEEKTASSIIDSLENGQAALNFRLRYEDVKQQEQGAQALTLRSRLSYKTLPYELFTAFVEFDDVRAIGGDDNYNSGANGQLDDLFIEDPEGTEVNQAWLAYDIANTLFKYGKQSLILNNQRLLGGDSWRQNEQTFSALSIRNETLNYLRLEFAQLNRSYSNQAKELASAHQDINAKLLNLNYRGFWLSDLSIYALWISDAPDNDRWASSTYGINFSGDLGGDFSIAYQLDFARQEDAGANPAEYSVSYALFDLVFGCDDAEVQLGYERLGAERDGYFVAPLGSHHTFQGLSDQFSGAGLGNVPGGIQDSYLGFAYPMSTALTSLPMPVKMSVTYHDFYSVKTINGIRHLGEEWLLKAELDLENYQLLLQYADYHADHFATDERKFWLSVSAAF